MSRNDNSDELLRTLVDARRSSVRYFSSANKQERERWIVEEFLCYIKVEFSTSDIYSSHDEPPDVMFREAKFEVKEILDENRTRHSEYKDALRQAEAATDVLQLFESDHRIAVPVSGAIRTATAEAARWREKYAPAVVQSLDLLFYFNPQSGGVVVDGSAPIESTPDLRAWRSVSVVGNDIAFVLAANENAPSFIREALGAMHRKDA